VVIPAAVLLVPGLPAAGGDEPGSLRFEEDGLVLGLDDVPLGPNLDLAVDSGGNLYVLDTRFMTVRKFDPQGRYLMDLGREGEAPGEFFNPICVAVGPDDRVYVAGSSSLVTVIEADGTPQESFKRHATGLAHDMCFDGNGDLYVCAYDQADRKMVHKYLGETHEYLLSFSDAYGVGADVPVWIERTYAGGFIQAGDDGTILYSQFLPQLVRVFDPGGKLLATHEVRSDECPPPKVKTHEEGVTFMWGTSGSGLLSLAGGAFLTVLSRKVEEGPWPAVVDIYDADGVLRNTATWKDGFAIEGRDGEGRVFVLDERDDQPVLVRGRIVTNRD
jgi:hypothetical protein